MKKNMTKFLCDNNNVLAYNLADKKWVSRDVIEHRLNIKKEAKAVRQKKRNFALDE